MPYIPIAEARGFTAFLVKSVYIEDEGEDLELLTDEEIEEIKQLCQRIERMQDMFVFELHKPEVIVRCL